jgi:hypothetical protein
MRFRWVVYACPICGDQRGRYDHAPCEGEDDDLEPTHELAEIQSFEVVPLAIAEQLAYALEVHLYGGQGEFADYSVAEANQFAKDALSKFREDDEEEAAG